MKGAARATFEDRFEAAFAELEQAGLSSIVGISHEGGPLILREFGAAKDDGVAPGDTQVDLNSITKTVTGVMVAELVEQGNVRLDETLAEIFADVPNDKAGITVHQLLTHSAGLPESIGHDHERLSKEGFLKRAFDTDLMEAPGKRYRYSNVGFSVLAAIIEERSGKSYDVYLQEDVLAGTGVQNTGYLSVYEDSRSLRTARDRTVMEASWGGHEPYWNLIGNGGLVSTAEDFIRFRQAFKAGDIVDDDLVEKVQTKHIPENPEGTSYYGYGLVVQDGPPELGRYYWHDGGNPTSTAYWADLEERGDIIFAAAANSKDRDVYTVILAIAKHLYGLHPDE